MFYLYQIRKARSQFKGEIAQLVKDQTGSQIRKGDLKIFKNGCYFTNFSPIFNLLTETGP